MGAFESCNGCVAPKRYPGCHGTCPEYKKDRAKYDQRKAKYDKDNQIGIAIYQERTKKVNNALKGYRGNKIREK